ncbi:MAG: preprotein translocase subunit SecE [Patescibacteria group bacterium]|jgi:preprotein translocase subunit SecE
MSDINFTAPDFGSSPKQYLAEVKTELKRVQWPTKEYIVRATLLVLGVSVVVGALLGGLDLAFTQLFSMLLQS